jgi:hypothetical protein
MGGAAFSRYPSKISTLVMGIAKALHPSYALHQRIFKIKDLNSVASKLHQPKTPQTPHQC